MDDVERDLARAARKRKQYLARGFPDPICPFSATDDILKLQRHHLAGKEYSDTIWPVRVDFHQELTAMQRDHPLGGADPRNPFEVIGRWCHNLADFFELLLRTFRIFGDFLIGLARDGYGTEFSLPTVPVP
jgi:hypothetical protein